MLLGYGADFSLEEKIVQRDAELRKTCLLNIRNDIWREE